MSRVTKIQTNFTAGVFSPRLFGRVDVSKYGNAAETITNGVVQSHGGIYRRPGTKFVNEVRTSSDKCRLIPFEFNAEQSYCVELGDEYMRFYTDQGAILNANQTITGITQANPGVVTVTAHPFSNGDWVYISSVAGMTEVNGKYYKVANKATNTFELQDIDGNNVNTTGYTAYTSGGTAASVVQIASPYDKDDLFEIQFAQTADVLYMVHKNYPPKKLSRTSNTAWTIANVTLIDGPYLPENVTTTTFDPSDVTGDISITASATTGINGGDGFQSTDVGRIIRIGYQADEWTASTAYAVGDVVRNSGNVYEAIQAGTSAGSGGPNNEGDNIVDGTVTWKFIDDGGISYGYATITNIVSTTIVDVTVERTFASHSADTHWSLGAYSDTTGYPRAVAFFEQRLFFAGSKEQPQTIWGSKSGDFETFTPSALDDGSINVTIATDQVNAIRWLSPGNVIAIGTAGGEFTLSSSNDQDAITPTNIRVVRQGTRGSYPTRPIRFDNRVLFIQYHRRKLREMVFEFATDSFVSPDLTILAEHISGAGFVEMAYQQEPDSVIWLVRDDGALVALTFQKDQEVVGWHLHQIGGTGVAVESVTAISGDGYDEVWMIVKRTINSVTRRYVEVLQSKFDTARGDAKADAFFVDSGLTYSGSATATLTGLDHLEGETVNIFANGSVYPNQTVTSGQVTGLSPTVTSAVVGLGYDTQITTLRPEAGGDDGTAQGRTKRVFETTFRFLDTLGAEFGLKDGTLDRVLFRSGSDPMDSSPPLFTGDKTVQMHGSWEEGGQVTVKQTQPLPFELSSVITRIITHAG